MEPTINEPIAETKEISPLHQVTPLSKYLAMLLFIIMPFLGGWIGYTYAPEKVVEVVIDSSFDIKEEQKSPTDLPQPIAVITPSATSTQGLFPVKSTDQVWSDGCDGAVERHFSSDGKNVYYDDLVIKEADPKTFTVVSTAPAPCEEVYARDEQRVFYKDKVIEGANPINFSLFDSLWNGWRTMGPYSHDDRYVYYEDKLIEKADVQSFNAQYEENFASDKQAVYQYGVIVEGAEPNTFKYPVSEGV